MCIGVCGLCSYMLARKMHVFDAVGSLSILRAAVVGVGCTKRK